jgi:hypothetical protein
VTLLGGGADGDGHKRRNGVNGDETEGSGWLAAVRCSRARPMGGHWNERARDPKPSAIFSVSSPLTPFLRVSVSVRSVPSVVRARAWPRFMRK